MITFAPVSIDSARTRLAPLIGVGKVDTSDGLCDVDEIIGAGRAFQAERDGVPVVLVVLQKVDRAHGKELEIRAAVALGQGGQGVTDEVVAGVESAFGYDCDVMTIYTRRGGLVRKLERAGYREAAKIMRKKIDKCTA
jgi:hypothetical protein